MALGVQRLEGQLQRDLPPIWEREADDAEAGVVHQETVARVGLASGVTETL